MSSETPDEGEAMRLAFEQFMMTGNAGAGAGGDQGSGAKKKKKKKSKRRVDDGNNDEGGEELCVALAADGSQLLYSPAHVRTLEQQVKQFTRRQWQLFRSFCDKIVDEWIQEDDHLRDVVESIVGIRSRIRCESSLRLRLAEGKSSKDSEWKTCGYGRGASSTDRALSGCFLTAEDVEIALSHDLSQHERMLSAVRSVTSNLSKCHEFLGRKLDDIIRHHLEGASMVAEDDDDDPSLMSQLSPEYEKSLSTAMMLMEKATSVFQMLSMELYRKQCMSEALLEVKDALFKRSGHSDGSDEDDAEYSKTASRCLKAWPRGAKNSCINQEMLSNILRLGSPNYVAV